ncbi:MAG: YbhB/YbcL family Raf kinase inhibitor-like protein [Patescibacteria group bacterium]|jgi:hypothetical protein
MKKGLILIVLLLVAAAGIFYLFSRNSRSFSTSSDIDQLEEQANYNSSLNNMLTITSVFSNGGQIPDTYGCHGSDVNPPLNFSGVPTGAQSLALIVDDPDAPSGDWVHWLIFNIDPKIQGITEDSVPAGAILGMTSSGKAEYGGPCPPSGTHHYHFKLYVLDTILDLSASAKKSSLLSAMKGHIISQAELVGTYSQ